jgi:hypothetical protein
MKTGILAVLTALTLPGFLGIPEPLIGAAENPQDQERIEKLEKRVQELEARVRQLETILQTLNVQQAKAVDRAILAAKNAGCKNNLRQLWTLQYTYRSQFGGPSKAMPTATGPAFWLTLLKTKPPLLDETELECLVCPLSGKTPKAGFTTYRGPAKPVALLGEDDAVGCCEPGHHPDGTISVLMKSGDVVTVGPGDPVYKRALETTTNQTAAPEKDRK